MVQMQGKQLQLNRYKHVNGTACLKRRGSGAAAGPLRQQQQTADPIALNTHGYRRSPMLAPNLAAVEAVLADIDQLVLTPSSAW